MVRGVGVDEAGEAQALGVIDWVARRGRGSGDATRTVAFAAGLSMWMDQVTHTKPSYSTVPRSGADSSGHCQAAGTMQLRNGHATRGGGSTLAVA